MAHPSLLALRGGEIRVPPLLARSGPVVLMPRRIPGGVAAVLDALPDGSLPRLDYEGPAAGLRRTLRAAVAERLARPRWLANWLLDDVLDKAALMAELTGGAPLRVALRTAEAEDGALAVAETRLRLVTSYRGPGTEWVAPRLAAGLAPGAEPAAAALRHLGRGDVAVLRGGADEDGPGVLHRAAPGDAAALRLTIDEAPRPRRPAPPGAERAGRALQ